MKKMTGIGGLVLALALGAQAITIEQVGDGDNFDEEGTNAVSYRTFGIPKSFDLNGDDIYGSHGYFFFGQNGGANAGYPTFSRNTQDAPSWVTNFSAGADFASVAEYATYTVIDDPAALPSSNTVDWTRSAIATAPTDVAGAWAEIMTFAVDSSAPTNFRLGIMTGNEASTDGRWSPVALRLSVEGGPAVTVTNLPNLSATSVGFVFFDVTMDGAGGAFSIEGQTRDATVDRGPSIAGLTFDEASSVQWPGAALELEQDSLSLDLYAPDTRTNGTIDALYVMGAALSDVEILSLAADAGFSASVVSSTLSPIDMDEAIVVVYTNAVGLQHGDTTNSSLVVSWSEVGSGVTNVANAALDVTYYDTPIGLALAPDTLSLTLNAPDTSASGTIVASYVIGQTTSNDVEIVSLVADSGFSASVVSATLGPANLDEEITVTYTNAGALVDHDDTTNSMLVVSWTEVGSGVTNIADAALDVTYYDPPPLSDLLVGYDVLDANASTTSAATTNAAYVMASDLTVSTNAGASFVVVATAGDNTGVDAGGTAFGSVGDLGSWTAASDGLRQNSHSNAIVASDYFTFTLTPAPGAAMTLAGISFKGSNKSSASTPPEFFAVHSSIDGLTNTVSAIGTGEITHNGPPTSAYQGFSYALTGAGYRHITTATEFRVYLWGGADGASKRIYYDKIIVKGFVTSLGTTLIVR